MKTFVRKQQLARAKIILSIEASQLHTLVMTTRKRSGIACRRCTGPVALPHTYHSTTASSTCTNRTTNVVSWSQTSKRLHSSLRPQAYLRSNKDIIWHSPRAPRVFFTFIIALDPCAQKNHLGQCGHQTPERGGATNTHQCPAPKHQCRPHNRHKVGAVAALLTTVRGKCLVSEITCTGVVAKVTTSRTAPHQRCIAATTGTVKGDRAW